VRGKSIRFRGKVLGGTGDGRASLQRSWLIQMSLRKGMGAREKKKKNELAWRWFLGGGPSVGKKTQEGNIRIGEEIQSDQKRGH